MSKLEAGRRLEATSWDVLPFRAGLQILLHHSLNRGGRISQLVDFRPIEVTRRAKLAVLADKIFYLYLRFLKFCWNGRTVMRLLLRRLVAVVVWAALFLSTRNSPKEKARQGEHAWNADTYAREMAESSLPQRDICCWQVKFHPSKAKNKTEILKEIRIWALPEYSRLDCDKQVNL